MFQYDCSKIKTLEFILIMLLIQVLAQRSKLFFVHFYFIPFMPSSVLCFISEMEENVQTFSHLRRRRQNQKFSPFWRILHQSIANFPSHSFNFYFIETFAEHNPPHIFHFIYIFLIKVIKSQTGLGDGPYINHRYHRVNRT